MPTKILVAFDGSEPAQRALGEALSIARAGAIPITVVAIAELLEYADTRLEVDGAIAKEKHHLGSVLDAALEKAATSDVPLTHEVRVGHPSTVLLKMIREGSYDLLVIGDKGHSTMVSMFLGTTAYNLSRKAPCSVLLVK